MQHVPIPAATPDQRAAIESLVTRILAAKKSDPDVHTADLEAEIDRLVYRLYDLTAEEIAIVGGTEGRTFIPAGDQSGTRPQTTRLSPSQKKPAKPTPKKRPRKPTLPPSREGWS